MTKQDANVTAISKKNNNKKKLEDNQCQPLTSR